MAAGNRRVGTFAHIPGVTDSATAQALTQALTQIIGLEDARDALQLKVSTLEAQLAALTDRLDRAEDNINQALITAGVVPV